MQNMRRKKSIIRYTVMFFLIMNVFAITVIFYPRTYNVPDLKAREGTKYWKLSTGSTIAYTLIPSKGIKKPYPVLYLHGGPGGPVYDRNIELLALLAGDGYDVYLYDQVGGGLSQRLSNIKEYTAERHKQDLEEIVNRIGQGKVILIGQSWGAMLAVLFAADNPDKVEKMILSGPGPVPPVNKNLRSIRPPDSLNLKEPAFNNKEASEQVQNIRSRAMQFFARRFGIRIASDNEADDFQYLITCATDKTTVCDTSLEIFSGPGAGFYVQVMTMKSMNRVEDPRPKLKNTCIPVLIMKGQCDNQPWGYTQEYCEIFPDHKLIVIQGAGHSIGLEKPKIYIQAIRDFLK